MFFISTADLTFWRIPYINNSVKITLSETFSFAEGLVYKKAFVPRAPGTAINDI